MGQGPWVHGPMDLGPRAGGRAPGRGHPGGRATPFVGKPQEKQHPEKTTLWAPENVCFCDIVGNSLVTNIDTAFPDNIKQKYGPK